MSRSLETVETPPGPAPPASAAGDRRSAILLVLLAAGATAFWFLPLDIPPPAHKALAIGLFMIAAWMTQVLDHGISGILGCFLFWTLGAARFETAFSGFADTSAWFLFGAVCFGLMAGKSGLARRLAFLSRRLSSRCRREVTPPVRVCHRAGGPVPTAGRRVGVEPWFGGCRLTRS